MLTIDSTLLWCLYSAWPFVSLNRACTYALYINFMNTFFFIPSIWIMPSVFMESVWHVESTRGCHMRWYVDWLGRMYTLLYWDVRPLCTNTTLLLSLLSLRRALDLTTLPFTFDSKDIHSAHSLSGQKLWADWTRTNIVCFRRVLPTRVNALGYLRLRWKTTLSQHPSVGAQLASHS